jgi:hypothetical protein
MIISNEIRRHEAIRNIYSEVVVIREAGSFDNKDAAIEIDEDLITAEVARLQGIYDGNAYQRARQPAYAEIAEQLDQLYHDMAADKGDKTGTWFAAVKAVKDANPKP